MDCSNGTAGQLVRIALGKVQGVLELKLLSEGGFQFEAGDLQITGVHGLVAGMG